MSYDAIKSRITQKKEAYKQALASARQAKAEKLEATDKKETSIEAQSIIVATAEVIQNEAHGKIAGVVSRCLKAVFDDPYEFSILFSQKRGRTEAELVFKRGGLVVNPLQASGGGTVDVAAFALRVSCLMLSRPTLRRVLVFDEPFKNISEEYLERVRDMVEALSKDLDIQFIMVTHIKELVCGKVIEIDKESL